jgi:hypothetical protein
LVNIDNISQLPSLTTVDLSFNQIVDLRPLLALTSLTELNLHSNLMYETEHLDCCFPRVHLCVRGQN